MAKTTPSTIFIGLNDSHRPIYNKLAAAELTAGDLVMLNSSGALAKQTLTDSRVAPIFVLEQPYADPPTTAVLTETYDSGESVRYRVAQPGDIVYAMIAISQDIAIGDTLNAGGIGHLQEASAGQGMAIALEVIDTTSAAARAKVLIF